MPGRPQKARVLLHAMVESSVWSRAPGGYTVHLELKDNSPEAWEGDGAGVTVKSCGGRI